MMTDPGIILFGKKIGLPESPKIPNFPTFAAATEDESHGGDDDFEERIASHDERKDEFDDNPRTPSIDEEGAPEEPQTTGTDDGDSTNLQPTILKKPDKILPCPRCESMNTKFCYYNNSNINQPRHFCKSCQRYWTAGGTMRNMPVGAGRRKKKNPPSHCRYIISQEAFESPQKVLSFGPNSPHLRPNLNVDDCSSGSNVITPNPVVEKSQKTQENNGFHSQVHWIPGAPWIPIPIPGYPPMPIYPPPYWNPAISWVPNYSMLGKRSSDTENEELKKQRNSVLTPKTLRIDNPDEAAKSSIWATLGIKNENSTKRGIFKAFEPKGNEKKRLSETECSPALHANPAALSRSLCFQERA